MNKINEVYFVSFDDSIPEMNFRRMPTNLDRWWRQSDTMNLFGCTVGGWKKRQLIRTGVTNTNIMARQFVFEYSMVKTDLF